MNSLSHLDIIQSYVIFSIIPFFRIDLFSKSAQIENESTKAFEEYSIEINPSYGTDSDVSSLPDGEIVSDSDEFVDAIQSHYLLVGERSAMTELDDAESLSSYENLFFDLETDMVYGDSDYSEGSDFGEEEVHDEDVDEEEEEEKEDEQIDEIDAISTPRPSSFVLSRGLSSRRFNFKRPKLSFRKQAVRNIESLNMDFPKLARNKSRKKKEDKKKRQPHSRDLESVSSSTVSSKSFSVSTLSTFVPPAPFGEPEGNLPTSFLPPRQQNDQEQKSNPLSIYFDKQLFENGIPSLMTTNFYTEHAIFIQAVLQLLDEREKVGVEAAADDPNTIKSGPLKKKMSLRNGKGGFGRLGWKMKYVEIRKGMFSYYQNSKISEGKLVRRNISLRANTCSCRCSPKLDQGNSGFAFELIDESGTITTWMSNSKEGRNAWIRAINEGMIGKPNLLKNNEDEGPSVENNSLPSSRCSMKPLLSSKNSFDPLGSSTLFADGKGIDKYSIIQNLVYSAKTKDEYLNAFEDLWGNSFQIPSNIINLKKNKSKRVVISQLWKQLSRGTYSINNHILRGDTPYGPERTLGGLTRCILEYDQTHLDTITSATNFSPISEVQAINYARDILGSCTDISMDRCLTAVEDLCLCSNLVSLVPFLSEIKPINLIVTHTDGNSEIGSIDGNKIFGNELEKSGWLTTRNRSHRNWRTLFCVLSEGVLSYYEEESPRPHLLKGQFVLMGAKMYVSEVEVHAREEKEISSSNTSTTCYVIRLIARNGSKERLFILKEKEELNSWRAALENMIGLSSPESNTISPTDTEKKDVYKIMENDESEDRRLQKKNLADIFRDAVQRGVGSNIPFSVNELGGEIERTISMPPSKDVNILSRLRPRVNSGDIIVRPDSGGKDFQTQLESRIKQLRKPLLHVFKSGHSSVVPDMKEDFSNQQQKPSVMIKVETSTVYRICSLKSEGNLTDDTWG